MAAEKSENQNCYDVEEVRRKCSRRHSKNLIQLNEKLEENRLLIKQLVVHVNEASAEFQLKLAKYSNLKQKFARLTKDNDEWRDWLAEQTKTARKMAEYAKIPERFLDTVVLKSGKSKSFKLYYGKPSRVYDEVDICRIIRANGAVYHKDSKQTYYLVRGCTGL